jgi:glutathione S-transferase
MLTLVIGDRNFSSWSLRPWLAARQAGIPFTEVSIRLGQPDTGNEIRRYSPSGKVPCLIDEEGGRLVIWDSLAICEYLAERAPSLWPADQARRAEARSISAEMHAGFLPLRQQMAMDIRASQPGQAITPAVACRYRAHRGHLGDLSASLCRPVLSCSALSRSLTPCTRRWSGVFVTYDVDLPPAAQAWVASMRALPAMREWQAGALAEPL